MTQTLAEKDHILELGADGRIYCLDLAHHDGQTLAATLAHDFPDVAAEVRSRLNNRQYVLVLMPKSQPKPTVVLANSTDLVEAMTKLYEDSKHYGNMFAVVCAPANSKIKDLIAELQQTQGSA